MPARSPLGGLRVLAIEQYGAGPFGTQFLADLGAEVVKIEHLQGGGDISRTVGPHFSPHLPKDRASLFFQAFNRNKKSIALDLAHDDGRAVLRELARGADALIGNLRGDVPARLGLTHADLAEANPRIVCAHLSAYGREGPRAAWPGYDYLMQAETGYFALTGEPDGPPSRMGLSVIDMMAGTVTALGVLAGVMEARRSGIGRDVDVSLFDVAAFHLNYVAAWTLGAGANQKRVARSAHPSMTPCQTYATADGWIFIMCNKEKFWRRLCAAIGREAWLTDPRFAGFPERLVHRDLLTGLIDEALSARTTAEWMALFGGRIPASPILDVAQALANPFLRDRGLVREARTEDGAAVDLMANPIRTAGLPPVDAAAPGLGQHTDALLRAAGFSAERIAGLRAKGVVG